MTDLRCTDPVCSDGPLLEGEPAPRMAVEGLMLCRRCADRLEQRLAELPARQQQLRSVLLHGMSPGASLGNSPTKGTPPLPSRGFDTVHDVLEQMHAVVVGWVMVVRDQRKLKGRDRNEIATLAPWLLGQLDWLLLQPFVGDLADEVRDVSVDADKVAQVHLRWNRLEAPCPACDARELGRWDGESQVQCAACGDAWSEADYPRLALVTATDQRHSLTASQAAARANVKPETFRQWVSRGKVRRLGTVDGQARYSTADVDALTGETA